MLHERVVQHPDDRDERDHGHQQKGEDEFFGQGHENGVDASTLQGTEEREIQDLAAVSLLPADLLGDHEVIDLSSVPHSESKPKAQAVGCHRYPERSTPRRWY